MTKPFWSGVFPAVTTQMKRDESLDLDANARHLDALIDSGVKGIIMLGSLGENATLAPDEKRSVVRASLEAVSGRVPVLSGVAENSTAAAVPYARDWKRWAWRASWCCRRWSTRPTPRETIAHFRTVARATDLPIMVYNNPVAYGVDITPEMFAELADEPNFVAIKESSGERAPHHRPAATSCGDRYALLLRRRRPGAGKRGARHRRLGRRAW